MITVACLWVRGHVPFTAEYVVRLRSMVRRHLKRKHRFVCLTDRPEALRGIECIPAAAPPNAKAWWAKVRLFSPATGFKGRVLYLDLDTLVLAPLDPIVDYGSPFAIVPHSGTFRPPKHDVVRRYNSSVMVFDGGKFPEIYCDWTPGVARRLWGDQDWIGERLPDLDLLPLPWFPRISECRGRKPEGAKVVLMKVPKNEMAARQFGWVREAWR